MLDVSVAYNRYSFLGPEFLTWLWWMIETRPGRLGHSDPDFKSLEIGNRIVLENRPADGAKETVTIKGDDAGMEEGLLSLRKGALVSEMNLVFTSGENRWHFTVKGESLSLSSLQTPETAAVESDEELEGAVLEKTFLLEKLLEWLDSVFQQFVRRRLDVQWSHQDAARIRSWIQSA